MAYEKPTDTESMDVQKKISAALLVISYIIGKQNNKEGKEEKLTLHKICIFYLKLILYLIKKKTKNPKNVLCTSSHPLQLDVIPLNVFKKLIKLDVTKCDIEKCILVSNKVYEEVMVKNKGIESADNKENKEQSSNSLELSNWFTIVFENELGVKFKRTVQILCLEELDNQVLISDENMFNIIQQIPTNGSIGKKSDKELQNQCLKHMTSKFTVISLVYLCDYIPRHIDHVNFELINTFHNQLSDDYIKKLLENYFKYPRYHHLNDIIRINVKQNNLDIFKTEEANYTSDLKFMYFKVCDIKTATELWFEKQNIVRDNKVNKKLSDKNGKKGDTPENYKINVNNVMGRLTQTIPKLLEQNHHGFYIWTPETSVVVNKSVSSFIPNIIKKSSYYTQDVDFITNYKKYILDSYNACPTFEELLKCVKVFHSGGGKRFLNFEMNQIFLLTGSHNAGTPDVIQAVAEISGVHIKKVDCISLVGSVPTIFEKNLNNLFERAKLCAPCMLVFHNIEDICTDHAGNEDPRSMQHFIYHLSQLTSCLSHTVVVCTSAKPDKIHHQIKRLFLKSIDVVSPKEAERHSLIDYQLKLVAAGYEFDSNLVEYLAANTAGFERHDLLCLVGLSIKNKSLSQGPEKKTLCKEDFKEVHAALQSRYSDRLDAPSVPNVSWDDIGGLSKLKDEILSTFRAVKRSSGLKRSGLLLFGPPGTGKTLIAKAVATECRMNFLAVKGPELLNKYIGQSEENIRNVFIRARSAAPCVVFFDELDSLAPRRGQEDQSSGVMDRVVSQLLAEMDGVHASKDIFILGATNRVDLLDPAILRPGRFDKSLCVGLYEDRISQLGVLKAVVRKFHLSEDVHLESLVEHFPPQMSGADMYSICSDAWTTAVRRIINHSPDVKHVQVQVNMQDFLAACPPAREPETSPLNSEISPEIEVPG